MFSEPVNLILAVTLAFFISSLAYKKESLSKDGAVAAFLLGSLIFGLGGIKWSVPLLTFFITSSFFSNLRKKRTNRMDEVFEKTGKRDFWQVVANGGFGGILVMVNFFYPNEIWFLLYTVYLAVMTADTWATELGTLKMRKTYNITTFRQVEQGVSGGVSVAGMLAALIGAAVIGLSSAPWLSNLIFLIPAITFTGFGGSIIDSFLGATVQVQYGCRVCGKVTERKSHCGSKTVRVKGLSWFNNDWVNFVSGMAGVFIFYIIFSAIA